MAITSAQQQDLIKVGVGMFNASLGGYIGPLAAAIDPAGTMKLSISQLYDALAGSDAFKALNFAASDASTNAQFATWYTNTVLGTAAAAADITTAATYLQSLLDAGTSRGAMMKVVVDYLSSSAALADTKYGAAAQMFQNKVTVATSYTITQSGTSTTITDLQATISSVTNAASSVTSAIAANSGANGQSYALTANQDTFTGTNGNDTFTAGSAQDGAGNLINTMQTVDKIDGGAGSDTINITLTAASGTAGVDTVAPALLNMENVAVRFADTGFVDVLDLSGSTGVTSVTINNSANVGTVNNIGSAANLAVKNQQKGANFDNLTATTLNLTVDTVGTTTAQQSIDLGVAGAADVATTLNLTLNASNVKILDTKQAGADVATTLSVAATGTNKLWLDVADTTVTAATVTGTGSVDLSNGGANTLTALKTLTATDNSGGVTVLAGTTPTAITTGSGKDTVTVGALANNATITLGAGNDKLTTGALAAAKTFTIDAGDGNDTLDLSGATAAAIVKITAGAGDDIVKVGPNLNVFATGTSIAGGDGTNTIGITDGADITTTTAALLSGFQTLEIAGAVASTYDVSLLSGITAVSITGADIANVTLNKVSASLAVGVTSTKATDLAVTGVLTLTPNDASGSSDALTFTMNAIDGDNDGVAEGNITFAGLTLTNDAAGKGVETIKLVSNVTPDADNPDTTADETLKPTDYTNTLTALAGTSLNKTLDVTANANLTVTPGASLTALATVKVAGAGTFIMTSNAANPITSVDASAATGKVTINAVADTKALAYIGSSGVDTLTIGTGGSTIYTGKGADVVTLGATKAAAGALRDTFVVKAATDSQITDTSKDGKIVLGTDTGFDTVTNFDRVGDTAVGSTTVDVLDVTNLSFAGAQRGVVDVSSLVTIASTNVTSITGLFSDPAGSRGIAFATDATNGFVFIDANKDGNFTAADDIVIKLMGVTAFTEANVNF